MQIAFNEWNQQSGPSDEKHCPEAASIRRKTLLGASKRERRRPIQMGLEVVLFIPAGPGNPASLFNELYLAAQTPSSAADAA